MSQKLSEIKNQVIALRDRVNEFPRYYTEYFSVKRPYGTKLTNVPKNPKGMPHILEPYGVLPVDTIGRIIHDLIKRYEHEDYMTRRTSHIINGDNGEQIESPIYVIGKPKNMVYQDQCDENIIITYDPRFTLEEYPSNFPVNRVFLNSGKVEEFSNYINMFGDINGLVFDPKGKEYIYELICNLAYLQYQFGMKQMSQQGIWRSYERIYKVRPGRWN